MKRLAIALMLVSAPAAAQLDSTLDSTRYEGCVNAVKADPAKAEQYAVEWQALGGGLPAKHCQALAQLERGYHAAAAATLSSAASMAEVQKSPMASDLWGQAGNAALLAGDAKGAVGHFNSAIVAAGEFSPRRTASLLVDRARAQVELKSEPLARADLIRAMELDPQEPIAFTLASALARRANDMALASRYIARASELAPSDPDVMLEQANVAAANGDMEGARQLWGLIQKAAPSSDAAKIAARELAR